MEAIEYGLSNLISSLWKKEREKQWRAVYQTSTCLFTYGRDLSSCVIRIVWENYGAFTKTGVTQTMKTNQMAELKQ